MMEVVPALKVSQCFYCFALELSSENRAVFLEEPVLQAEPSPALKALLGTAKTWGSRECGGPGLMMCYISDSLHQISLLLAKQRHVWFAFVHETVFPCNGSCKIVDQSLVTCKNSVWNPGNG